ncbi:unnamed protein product [Orchesella dallaii]|uniref:Uncharacterized protein n=1 Tax=Orchesella dallaii TaxID=48710 RepID=A0ABP1RRW9_9HEXA
MAQENHDVNSSASGEVGVDCDGFENIANWETVEGPSIVLNNPDGTEQPLGVPEIVKNPSFLTSDNKEEDERLESSEESDIRELDLGAAEEVEAITISSDEEQESNDYRPRSSRQYNELLHMTRMAAVAPVLCASVTIDPNNISVPLTHDQVYSNTRADGSLDLRAPNQPLDLRISSVPLDLTVRFEPIDCSVHSLPVVQIVEKEETDSAQDSLINNFEVVPSCKEEPEDIENESSDDDLGSLAPVPPASLVPSPSPQDQVNNELEPLAPSPLG